MTNVSKLLSTRARVIADRDKWQKKIHDAYRRFVAAVHNDPDSSAGAWAGYRATVHSAQASVPEHLPAPESPSAPGSNALQDEYRSLAAWAVSVRAGTVEGVGRDTSVRLLTTQERDTYNRRVAEYRASVAEHERKVQDACIWFRLMTLDEREEHGGSGGYAQKIDNYEERAKEFATRTGIQLYPSPRPANEFGFSPPSTIPPLPNPYGVALPTLTLPMPVESFDHAITAALAEPDVTDDSGPEAA